MKHNPGKLNYLCYMKNLSLILFTISLVEFLTGDFYVAVIAALLGILFNSLTPNKL